MTNTKFQNMYKIPLSPYAKTFYIDWLLDPTAFRYNLSIIQELHGHLDVLRLTNALKKYVNAHLILNSHIQEINEEPYWTKNQKIFELEYIEKNISHADLLDYVAIPFDLYNGPLYRFRLLKVREGVHKIILVFHHLLVDGTSMNFGIFETISHYYNNIDYEIKYSIEQQIELISGLSVSLSRKFEQERDLAKEFWHEKLSVCEGVDLKFLTLNSNLSFNDRKKSFSYGSILFSYDTHVLKKINQIARNYLITPYIYGRCILALLLYRYTQQEQFAIAYPIAINEGVDFIYGAQVNTNFISYAFSAKTNIVDLFNQSRKFSKSLKKGHLNFSYYPVNEILQGANKRILDIVCMQTNLKDKKFEFHGVTKVTPSHEANVDLLNPFEFEIELKESCLNYRVRYDKNIIHEEFLNNFVSAYQRLFLSVLSDLEKNIDSKVASEYPIIDVKEYHKIVYDWNKTEADYPKDKTVYQLFEEQVQRTPNNNAVVYQDATLTYQDLNQKANQLAHYLRELNCIKPDSLVALCLDRSAYMIIAILAVIKAGGAYVPIDPAYPDERIQYILKDTQVRVLLSNQIYLERLQAMDEDKIITILPMDGERFLQNLELKEKNNLEPLNKSKDLIYIIYTSGTSGRPKGVMVNHSGVINTIQALYEIYHITQNPKTPFLRIATFCNYVFDVSVSEFFVTLLRGFELHILSDITRQDVSLIDHYIDKYQINYIYLPPILLSNLPAKKHDTLQGIIYAGESCDQKTAISWLKYHKLYNYYGPTETSIYATGLQIKRGEVNLIGKPISNVTCYVLDIELNVLPIGVVGELYIGGKGLARGYLNQPNLTREKFISNPFQSLEEKSNHENERLYKTGDLVRWLNSGDLEYIGRNDSQVKIRGFRVELKEIEEVLNQHKHIKKSIIVFSDDLSHTSEKTAHQYLLAYYLSIKPLIEIELRDFLHKKLPGYMVPHFFIHLKKLPLSINGKLNYHALPKLKFDDHENYIDSSNALEDKIVKIYKKILGLNGISLTDDFFSLGGDSILAIQLVSRLRQELKYQISVKDIFDFKTIKKLAEFIQNKVSKNVPTDFLEGEQGLLEGTVSLLPIQKWFFSNNFLRENYWNQIFMLQTPLLNHEKLKKSIFELVHYHDAFRLRYKKDPELIQYYDSSALVEDVKIIDIRTLEMPEDSPLFQGELKKLFSVSQDNFNLEKGPVYCVFYLYGYADQSARICFIFHHLIIDAVSWRILATDLHSLYSGHSLGLKGLSYRQWSSIVNEYASISGDEAVYWENLLLGYGEYAQSLGAFKQEVESFEEIQLDPKNTSLLLHDTHRAYHTQINDVLLTALTYALSDTIGGMTHYVMLEGHGRETINQKIDMNRTMGWFTTLYPVKLSLQDKLESSLVSIKESLRSIPNKGLGYGILIGYDTAHSPKIIFNYLGQLDKETSSKEEWSIVFEQIGLSIHPLNHMSDPLSINGFVINGQLIFQIASQLSSQLTQDFARNFKKRLINSIGFISNLDLVEYTPSDFAQVTNEADLFALPLVSKGLDQYDWFDMTEMQKAYLLGRKNHYEIGNISNHIYTECYFKKLDVDKLERIINHLIEKQPVLRTVYSEKKLQQKFLSLSEILKFRLVINDFSELTLNDVSLQSIRDRLSHKLYDLEKFPLFTFEVTQFKDFYVLHESMELILLDVHSRQLFHDAINQLYRQDDFELSVSKVGFKDYQHYFEFLKYTAWYSKDALYWEKKIPLMPFRPALPFKIAPDKIKNPKFSAQTLYVEKQIWEQFKKKTRQYNLSYSSVLLSLYGSVIAYFSGQKEFLVTLTLFNRYAFTEFVDDIWGNFTTSILFQYQQCDGDIVNSLKKTHDTMWDDIQHALYSGLEVQRKLARLKELDPYHSVSPIVFTGIVNEEYTKKTSLHYLEDSESISKRYFCAQTSQAWIDLQAIEIQDGFMSKWLYVSDLFDEKYIKTLNTLYCDLICFLATHDWEVEVDLFVPPVFDKKIIENANSAIQQYSEENLFSYYEDFVRQHDYQKNIAIVDVATDKSYSYATLLEESEFLAKYITKVIDSTTDVIGILSAKGYNQVVGTLAIMKMGKAYLPLQIEWPIARIEEILKQSETKVILISKEKSMDEEFRNKLSCFCQLIIVEEALNLSDQISVRENLLTVVLPRVKPDDLAYIIYTSGSTGQPKGVSISHRGALNTINAINENFQITSKDTILALSELVFDLSVYDIFGLLAVGGRIIFPNQNKTKEPNYWIELINQYKITLWNTVPQLASLLIDATENNDLYIAHLRLFLLSGDWIPINLPCKIKEQIARARIISLGGATEGSIWSIWHEINKIDSKWVSIPYGTAMPNQKMYVLNQFKQHCPIDVVGSIYIGGLGVAVDYYKDPKKTADGFIHHDLLGRLYKTGDLGKWHKEGYIEFIGREDNQIKLQGYRVELGDISANLNKIKGISEAFVTVQKFENRNYVVAYLLPHFLNQAVPGLPKAEREVFRLKKIGIKENSSIAYPLFLSLDNKRYSLHKSYREFSTGADVLNLSQTVDLLSKEALKELDVLFNQDKNREQNSIQKMDLIAILKEISALKLEGRVLPKYLYPSAGSTYSIRTYLNIPFVFDEIQAGYYYYNPVEHGLCLEKALLFRSRVDSEMRIDFIVYWPAIEPLYSDKAKKFAYLEMGHILGLVLSILNRQFISFKLELIENRLDENNTLLASIVFSKKFNHNVESKVSNKLFTIDQLIKRQCNLYSSLNSKRQIDLREESIFVKVSGSVGRLLENGNALLLLEGNESFESLVSAGIFSQVLTDKLYSYDIGACMLGYEIIENVLYALVLGKIDEEEKAKAEVKLADLLIKDCINQELSLLLPDYMLPYDYKVLDKFPLTTNGKLDIKKLPPMTIEANGVYVAPSNVLEEELCAIYAEILGLSIIKISIHDDFFKLGGNSLLAIRLTTRLQRNFKINLADIFKLKTPANLAKFVFFTKDNLFQKLEDVKSQYAVKKLIFDKNKINIDRDRLSLLEKTKALTVKHQISKIEGVLLTGATGHLGINILYQLLMTTSYKIYLLVRAANNQEAYERVNHKFKLYFDKGLESYLNRIEILASDLSRKYLDLKQDSYQILTDKIDSVIHAAALVKHYGHEDEFYQANVQAIINLLEFSRLTRKKMFHYMSTVKVLSDGYIPGHDYYIFDENHSPEILISERGIYTQTKYEGELLVEKYREHGINGSIYRLGNVAMHSINYRHQENIMDNGFFICLKAILNLEIVTEELANVEISPVDSVALAIVKLFDKDFTLNQTYHVFNPNTCNLLDLFKDDKNVKLQELTTDEFIDFIMMKLKVNIDDKLIELFLLHQSWLQHVENKSITQIQIMQDQTEAILAEFAFYWPIITKNMLNDLVQKAFMLKIE